MTACKFVATDQPRVIPGRHAYGCAAGAIAGLPMDQEPTESLNGAQIGADGFACLGCLPCPEPHCRVCGRAHAEQTCADCLDDVRNDLREIVRMCAELPEEAAEKGVDSEAMNLVGPAADWEQWQHVKASVRVGRLPDGWQDVADHELHPLLVLGGWDACVRDALEHQEPEGRVTIAQAAEYVGLQLTYLAGFEDLPFEDLARDLRRCRAHIERVLHDGEQRDTGAPCLTCDIPLIREWGKLAAADGWRCPRCSEWRSEEDYRHNVAQRLHESREERVANAAWLTDSDMEFRFGVKAATVRKRAERNDIKSKWHSGVKVYRVSDMPEAEQEKSMAQMRYPVTDGAQEVRHEPRANRPGLSSFQEA